MIYVCGIYVSVSLPLSEDGVENSRQMSQQSASPPPVTPIEHSANYLQLVEPSTSTSDPQQMTDSETSAQAHGYLQVVG